MFKNNHIDVEIDIISIDFRDCVIFEIRNTDIVIAAMYIPPRNSELFDDIYFKNLELLCQHFNNRHLVTTGDLNTRVGVIGDASAQSTYLVNPDVNVNLNGKNLREMCAANSNFLILNGFADENKKCDWKFTFYRGGLRSQVDFTLSNRFVDVNAFITMDKYINSDHCPIMFSCSTRIQPSLSKVKESSEGIFSYTRYDVNRRIKSPIAWNRLNIVNATAALERLTHQLKTDGDIEDVDILGAQIDNGIYDVCKENCDKRIIEVPDAFHLNCNSTHFKAIAAINLFTYNILCKDDDQHVRFISRIG